MDRPLTDTSHGILGMLSLAPMSGYELAGNVDKTIANFWQISKSQVYSELARLEELGLVAGTDVAQERLPDKRTYHLTDAGERTLDDWLGHAHSSKLRLRSVLLLKVFFAHRMSEDRFRELVANARADAEAEAERLREIVEHLDGLPETFYTRATALYGMFQREAAIRWADDVTSSIPKPRATPLTANEFHEGAKEVMRSTPSRSRNKRS